ncbi:conserved hypothetical protein [Gloeothece citriformis PCC 7424]|uniref:Uncharacterized protein n=1 Tax=Gloeothece citriformis (strain PCC 7424) TaxID=65393 RepID=B7K8M4_GLOC7|nr:hypothetical protein [Gloeothece citriformis]ACK71222.1 conserved hypothetical protein [Gloeothece citriformis PCC 7424]
MTNEQILLETWRTLPSDKQLEVLKFIKSLQSNPPLPESSYQPKTELGKKLMLLRAKALEAQPPLLTWEELEREIADRRGERSEP